MKRYFELSHVVEDGMVTYKGLPAPEICDHMSREDSRAHYQEGTSFQIGRINLVANTGTYLDTPFHRYEDGYDLAELPLEKIADVPGRKIVSKGLRIGPEAFERVNLAGQAVLIESGWERHWGTEAYYSGNPFVSKEAAAYLVAAGVMLVGIDSVNIDDMADTSRPAHSLLLKAGIPIVEHMCGLSALPREGFRFFAVPVKIRGMGTFPVRAFAVCD